MAVYSAVASLNATNIRKALAGSVFLAPYASPALTAATLFAADGSLAATLPTGYKDLGITDAKGVDFTRSVKTDAIQGWGFAENVREDVIEDTETAKIVFEETNVQTLSLYTGVDVTTAQTLVNKAMTVDKAGLPVARYYRLLVLGVDNVNGAEFYIGRHYPRVRVTAYDQQVYSRTGALSYGVTLSAYTDPVLGISKREFYGGAAFTAQQSAMGVLTGP